MRVGTMSAQCAGHSAQTKWWTMRASYLCHILHGDNFPDIPRKRVVKMLRSCVENQGAKAYNITELSRMCTQPLLARPGTMEAAYCVDAEISVANTIEWPRAIYVIPEEAL